MSNRPTVEFFSEYHSATTGCGYLPLENWTTITVKGADRSSFLHNMCTNEINKLGIDEGCEAFFTDVKGKIVAHTFVVKREDEIVMLMVPNQAEQIINHLDRYIIREDVQLQDVSDQFTWLVIVGTEKGLATVTSNNRLVVQLRIVWPEGILIRSQTNSLEELTAGLSNSSAIRISEPVWNALRVESGLPLFGVDFDNSNLPQEVDRNAQAISFTKGCYLGQETIARLDALGHVNKQIVGLQIAGQLVPSPGLKITDGEKEVGTITSATWSPRLDAPLAMAMVRRGSNELGKNLDTDCGQATVVSFTQSVES